MGDDKGIWGVDELWVDADGLVYEVVVVDEGENEEAEEGRVGTWRGKSLMSRRGEDIDVEDGRGQSTCPVHNLAGSVGSPRLWR